MFLIAFNAPQISDPLRTSCTEVRGWVTRQNFSPFLSIRFPCEPLPLWVYFLILVSLPEWWSTVTGYSTLVSLVVEGGGAIFRPRQALCLWIEYVAFSVILPILLLTAQTLPWIFGRLYASEEFYSSGMIGIFFLLPFPQFRWVFTHALDNSVCCPSPSSLRLLFYKGYRRERSGWGFVCFPQQTLFPSIRLQTDRSLFWSLTLSRLSCKPIVQSMEKSLQVGNKQPLSLAASSPLLSEVYILILSFHVIFARSQAHTRFLQFVLKISRNLLFPFSSDLIFCGLPQLSQ